MLHRFKIWFYLLGLAVIILLLASCKKFVDVGPPINQLNSELVFTNDSTATAAIRGIYSRMMNNPSQFTTGHTTFLAGLSADELLYYTPSFRDEFAKNQVTETNHSNLASIFWGPAYSYIYSANLAIEGLEQAATLTPSIKNTLLGEARFIRAFSYCYLANLFGDVPLITASAVHTTARIPRTPVAQVYQQVIKDLEEAKQLVPAAYPTSERTRPNRAAVAALLARVYLYNQQWAKAGQEATEVISNSLYLLPANLNEVFLKGSKEAIWQLQPVTPSQNTVEGSQFIPPTATAVPTFYITPELLNAFEPADKRKQSWIASRTYASQLLHYPFKYKSFGNNLPSTEYYMVLRLAESYLVRAESRAQLQNLAGAIADLDMIRQRAGLAPLPGTLSQQEILDAIEKERRLEFFAEWGHRWLDLKRTNRATAVLQPLKGATWQPTDVLWPIPQSEINSNNALTQNPGY